MRRTQPGWIMSGFFTGRRIRLDDLGMFRPVTLAVMLLGDRPERVALHHRIHDRFGCGFLDLEAAGIDFRHAVGIAERQNDLLGFLLAHRIAGEFDLAVIDLDPELVRVEPVALDLLLQLVGGGRLRAAAEDLRSRFLDECEKAHRIFSAPAGHRSQAMS